MRDNERDGPRVDYDELMHELSGGFDTPLTPDEIAVLDDAFGDGGWMTGSGKAG